MSRKFFSTEVQRTPKKQRIAERLAFTGQDAGSLISPLVEPR